MLFYLSFLDLEKLRERLESVPKLKERLRMAQDVDEQIQQVSSMGQVDKACLQDKFEVRIFPILNLSEMTESRTKVWLIFLCFPLGQEKSMWWESYETCPEEKGAIAATQQDLTGIELGQTGKTSIE